MGGGNIGKGKLSNSRANKNQSRRRRGMKATRRGVFTKSESKKIGYG